ncbi:MAG: S8 family peptidase [Jatrophihabitans sp.]
MTAPAGGTSPERPIILGAVGLARDIRRPSGGGGRVRFNNQEARVQRLEDQFGALEAALGDQIQIAASIQASDPQLVLVMEARDENIDLVGVADKLGLELISQAETRVDPDGEFELASKRARSPLVTSCLHAICVSQTSLDELLSLWRSWRRGEKLPLGRTPLRDFFAHLKDVRLWGPQDRLKLIDWDVHFAGREPDSLVSIDIELWFRASAERRTAVQSEVAALLKRDGGTATSWAIIEEIGYHGLKATVPNRLVERLARGQFDAVQTVQSANVMYLRATGQVALPTSEDAEHDVGTDTAEPTGNPVLCLFDGVPASNHPLLSGRVSVLDPDDLESGYTVNERRHGTAMVSAAIWGDRGANDDQAAARPVLVRPILRPCDETMDRVEELPVEALAPDLMRRAFRDLFEEGTGGTAPSAPEIAIINLSVGDPAAPFDTVMSSWARTIDWLSYEYGVLVIVSAGNYTSLDLAPSNSTAIAALTGDARRQAMLEVLHRQQNQRRLIAPAESINALTIGATHDDASEGTPLGYRVDPNDGLVSVSPVSATGSGYRRSLKPDLAAPGGRAYFASGGPTSNIITFRPAGTVGPGVKVAAPAAGRETYTIGTSVAAALVSRHAARLHDIVDAVTEGTQVTRRQRASAIKALLVHGVGGFEDLTASALPFERAVGNGILLRDFSAGCATNEAVLLFLGQIAATTEQELVIPLPDGLSVREAKRIDTTLAWLSPVNWRHRQYRRAALSFVTPEGPIPKLGTASGLPADASKAGAATVQHLTWDMETAWASGQGSEITVRVKCYEQAGGLYGELIDFAAVASIWVAPTIGVDVYSQVRDQVRTPVTIQPSA